MAHVDPLENVRVRAVVVKETAKALLARCNYAEHPIWLPKSQVRKIVELPLDPLKNKVEILAVPAWLAKKQNLEDWFAFRGRQPAPRGWQWFADQWIAAAKKHGVCLCWVEGRQTGETS